uniref:Pinin/SDK/MemA protein domain-containing protein n=1 Tax=Parascaris univalens TaxID=6257 RepID=A0A915BBK5_PARUN
ADMDVDELSASISRAFDELRNIDDSISALSNRGERLGATRRRITDGAQRSDNFYAADRRDIRTVSVGSLGTSNKRRLVISADNDFYEGAEKRQRAEEGEEETHRTVQSSIVMPAIETKSREAAISELKESEKKEVNIRNRRMFSNLLLGTLQRFQKDEKKVSSVEKVQAEKQKEVERRLRATEIEEKERLAKERLELFEKRRDKERLIKSLQRKKAIIQYAEQKQEHYRKLRNFIQTHAKPPLFYLPAKHTLITLELLKTSAKKIDDLIERRRLQMENELKSPEERERGGDAADSDAEAPESSVKESDDRKANENGAVKKDDDKNGGDESDGEDGQRKGEHSPDGDASVEEGSDGEDQPIKQMSDDEHREFDEADEADGKLFASTIDSTMR